MGTSKNSSHEVTAESFPFAHEVGASPKNLRRGSTLRADFLLCLTKNLFAALRTPNI
jgi:hypothetical protein